MAKIRNFEDLQAWQKARQLAGTIYGMTRNGPFSHDFGLGDQIRRAAGSIMHNIAEGFDSGSDAEFRRFLRMARRSASEVQSQLYLALDAGHITADELKQAYDLGTEAKKLINGLIGYLSKDH